LRPFETCSSLVRYARAKALEVVGPYGLPVSGGGATPAMAASTGTAGAAASGPAIGNQQAPAASAGTVSRSAFSQTNVQEAGVDEPDLVKTDGRRMFAVERGRLW